jgi:hypothetical protein
VIVDGKESKAMADQVTTASKERLVNSHLAPIHKD